MSGDDGASPVQKFDNLSIRKLPDVDAIALIEAKRQQLLHRLYVDEKLGRDESAEPDPSRANISAEEAAAAKLHTPTYQRVPPFQSPNAANCNAATKALLLQATSNERLLPASASAVGFSHQSEVWTPVPFPEERGGLDAHSTAHDTAPIRGALVRTAGVDGVNERIAADRENSEVDRSLKPVWDAVNPEQKEKVESMVPQDPLGARWQKGPTGWRVVSEDESGA